jgi:hypothetical protein
MSDFLSMQAQARSDLTARFTCEHEHTEVRRRVIKGGAVQYVRQCLRCGEPQGNPIAKAKVLAESGGEPPDFDDELNEQWKAEYAAGWEDIRKRFDREAFLKEWYADYLRSPEWGRRRAAVMRRANGVCEGCGECPPTEVHHLTYKHVGREFLFELVALCEGCHTRAHQDEEGV